MYYLDGKSECSGTKSGLISKFFRSVDVASSVFSKKEKQIVTPILENLFFDELDIKQICDTLNVTKSKVLHDLPRIF